MSSWWGLNIFWKGKNVEGKKSGVGKNQPAQIPDSLEMPEEGDLIIPPPSRESSQAASL